ncbi:MAG: hypothetical protein SP4CHLAM17_11100 [Chlamydiales bacterium]|nr:hypothetical protein [Chlamydiales bacterium]
MNPIDPSSLSLIPHKESLAKLALLVTGVALTVLGGLQLALLLNLGSVSGWALAGPGLGLLSTLVVNLIAIKIQEKPTEFQIQEKPVESQLEALQKKNKATHIPTAEFKELVTFLQAHSPAMSKAIQEGSLIARTELYLSSQELTELPSSLRHLINLTKLSLYNTQLTTLPDAIGELTNLTQLNVCSNRLTTLPNTIGRLTKLTELDVYNNQLTVLPGAIGRLTKLTELDVRSNQLTALPYTMEQLTNLIKLNVSDNQLTVFPFGIGRMTKLTELNVSKNQLTALPDVIGGLTNLTELDVSKNQLTTLPDAIGQLTSLTQLNVYSNQLTALPSAIGQLINVGRIYLSYNNLTRLPDAMGQLTNLTQLYMSNNGLTALPNAIGDLSVLGTLQVDRNSNLSALPLSLGNCSQLTYLNIEGTDISRSNCDQILATCRNMRGLEAAEKLLHKIKLWRKFADIVEEWADPKFTKEQRGNLYEWLVRLEKARDFNRNQKELAETTCAILKTVHTDAEFREIFFNLIAGDLTACGDRAAMSLNLVYTDWKLYTLPAEASLSEKVQLLVGCGRAQKLRQAILSRYPGSENVEKVLYAEVNLRERLRLVTAITSMIYSEIGHVEDSVIKEMAQEIETIPVAELVVEFGCWENYLKKHHASEFSKIKSGIEKARKTLLTSLENDEIKEGEYQSRDKELQVQEQKAILQLTQQIITQIS